MRIVSKLVTFIGCVAILASCARPKPLIYKDVQRVSFKKADLTSFTLKVDLKLYNPNKYALLLKDPLIGIYINDNHVGYASIDDKVTIPPADTFILPAQIRVDLLKAIPNAYQLMKNREITLRLDGSLKAGLRHHIGRGGIFIAIPVHYEGKQKIDIKL